MPDLRNVELKARDPDPAATLAAALAAGAEDRGVLVQRDTYFRVATGRLKLREQEGAPAQLIAYARDDHATARTSAYRLVDVPDPDALRAALAATAGETVVVAKRRRLLLLDGVRIHLDEVDGLGTWVELEAVAPEDSDLSAEHAAVARLRALLGMADERVVAEGYAQLVARADVPTDLIDAARIAREHAHAPYSRFAVGAALRADTGAVFAGANVENASSSQGQCAEASAIGALIAAGATAIREIAVVADHDLITPCGGCRQRLAELADPGVLVHLCGLDGVRRTVALGELLPLAFKREHTPA
jgi:homotetrameric cytidine deaminase